MKRFCLFVLLVIFSAQVSAAESMSPRMAQRVFMILDRAEGDPEGALESLSQLIDSRSEDSQDRGYILYERAVLLVQYEQEELAREEIRNLLLGRADDYVPRLRFLLGQLELMDNDPEAAIVQLNIWLEQSENPRASELAIVAYANIQLEKFADGASALEQAIAASETPQNQWFELLAYCYTQLGRNEEAIALIERIIADVPSNARWWRQLASIYLLLEDVPKGAAGLAISSVVEELDFYDAINLAKLFNMMGMPADGAQVLETTFSANADQVGFENHMLLAELWMLAREFDLSVSEFELAATLDASGEANWRLGQLYTQREEYQQAFAVLTDAISGYGEDTPPQLYYLMAVVAVNLENFESASNALRRIEDDTVFAARAEQLNTYIRQVLAKGVESSD